MSYIRLSRSTKIKTDPKICLEVMYDFTHFLYKHKSSFTDFKVIKEDIDEQIFYYETKIFNFFPFSLISPIRRFISIKKLIPEQKMFKQIYIDIKSKKIVYLKCEMENTGNNITINNDTVIEISKFMYLFRKPLLWIINKKMDIMWNEDKEMLQQLFIKKDYQNIHCVPQSFNLNNFLDNKFDQQFKKNKIDSRISI
jgi:hypothetical protein